MIKRKPFFRFWRWLTNRDVCEICDGSRGTYGNENVIDGKWMCDYCHCELSQLEIINGNKVKKLKK